MVATKQLVAALERLGLSTYEARTYAALVRSGPVSGYQLSRASGVPRSRIYETLEKLVARGLVMTRKEQPPLYLAAPCEEMISRAAADLQRTSATIRASCAALHADRSEEGVWNLTGAPAVIGRAEAMVRSAARTVDITALAPDIRQIEAALTSAHARGCRIRAVVCGAYEAPFPGVLSHRYGGARTGDLTVVADSSEALAGITDPPEAASAAWSRAVGFVHIVGEYILHEIFIARAYDRLGPAAASLDDVYKEVFAGN